MNNSSLKIFAAIFSTLILLMSSDSFARSEADQQYINQLVYGSTISIRDVAKELAQGSEASQEVLDVLAELLLQNYKSTDGHYIDALSWTCKALGKSNQGRYRNALTEVVSDSGSEKLRKFAKLALANLSPVDVPQYVKGSVSLADLRKKESENAGNSQNKSVGSGTFKPISEIKVGMSLKDVYVLVGPPLSSRNYATGNRWRPFNMGDDVMRKEALYKGQGRIVFTNKDGDVQSWEVLEVRLNPEESGYP